MGPIEALPFIRSAMVLSQEARVWVAKYGRLGGVLDYTALT
jgi:hypothetical protein